MSDKTEIIKNFIEHMRAYPIDLDKKFNDGTITKEQWHFFGDIIESLIDCFRISREEAKELSRKELDKRINHYNLKILYKQAALYVGDHSGTDETIQLMAEEKVDSLHLEYWKSRRASPTLYWNYEVQLFLYYKWMDNHQMDEYYQRALIRDLMVESNYKNPPNDDLIQKQKKQLFSKMAWGHDLGETLKYHIKKHLREKGVPEKEIKQKIKNTVSDRK